MWYFQRPGFAELLLAELQRQQRCSQSCDTLLKVEGVSVPVHSWILSALSPQMSTALSAMPAPPPGQWRLLDLGTLDPRTLLRLVRLLYCGEMRGEGEEEKREAVSAAAKMGIHRLVERMVSQTEWLADAGVQTEPEDTSRRARWRREVMDGNVVMWREATQNDVKDVSTQTEEQQEQPPPHPPPHPEACYETIDLAAMQDLRQMDEEIPYVPISVISPQNEIQTASSAPAHATMSLLPCPPQATTWAQDHQGCWAAPAAAARDAIVERVWQEQLEQFEGNIPGFINYFLNPDTNKEEASVPGRGRGQRPRRARGACGGQQGARRPRGARAGRGHGRLTQTVDVQEVGVSWTQKLYLHRVGSRRGQGGGAVGTKLHLMTRELLKPSRRRLRVRGGGKEWDSSTYREMGGASKRRGRSCPQFKAEAAAVGRSRARAVAAAFSSPPPAFFSNRLPSSASVPPDPPAPRAPPPQEEQPEHLESLLEEVMIDLNILPKQCGATTAAPPPSSRTASQENREPPAGNSDPHSSAGARRSVRPANSEGELTDMLDRFLQSFEQQPGSGASWDGESSQVKERPTNRARQSDGRKQGRSESREGSVPVAAASPARPEEGQQTPEQRKKPKRRRIGEYLFSLQKPKQKKSSAASGEKTKMTHSQADEQLRQIPVVKLERSRLRPPNVRLQGGDAGQEVKNRAPTEPLKRKIYPTRSKFRGAQSKVQPSEEQARGLSPRRAGPPTPPAAPSPAHMPPPPPTPCDAPLQEGPPPPHLKRPWEDATEGHASAAKQLCSGATSPPPCDEIIDVETVSLCGSLRGGGGWFAPSPLSEARECHEEEEEEEEDDIVVDGDSDCGADLEADRAHAGEAAPHREAGRCPDQVDVSRATEEEEEEVDVTEGETVLVAAARLSLSQA